MAGLLRCVNELAYPGSVLISVQFVKRLQKEKKYDKFGAIGSVMAVPLQKSTSHAGTRYCFGGGIAGRIGATTSLFDSIVLAHPSALPDETIKAIKVNKLLL
jgi:hypothetical protein